jgi:hypothetical protein
MSATARKHEEIGPIDPASIGIDGAGRDEAEHIGTEHIGTEYATRGARALKSARPHLRMVSPLRAERASRGVFALVVTGLLVAGMVVILVINTSLAQGAFTVSELQVQEATLTQQEQALSQVVAAAGAPESLEQRARSLGMVPSENPVFLSVPSGRVLGKPKPAGGATSSIPRLLTPADATVTEAVDNASVGSDLPVAPGVGYDPAAADAAAAQAQAANADAVAAEQKATEAAAKKAGKKVKNPSAENNLWQDSTILDQTGKVSSGDAGLVAVPVP